MTKDGDRISILQVDSGGIAQSSVGFIRLAGAMYWYIWKATRITATVGPVLGQWHNIEVFANDAVGGGIDLYVDGVKVLSSTETSGGTIDGALWGAASNTNYPVEVDIDDCTIADAYIGPPSVLPKLTVVSNPELTVPVYVDDAFIGNTPITMQVVAGTHTVRVEQEVTR